MILTAIASSADSPTFQPDPVPFDNSVADNTLVSFMSSVGCRTGFGAAGFRYQDDGKRLVLITKCIPIWFVAICLMIPASVIVLLFLRELIWQRQFDSLLAIGCVLSPFIILDFLGFCSILNRRAGDGQVRLVVDRVARIVELKDLGLTIPFGQVRRLILVRGWQTQKDKRGSNSTWALELSVVAEGEWDGLRRVHVVTTGRNGLRKVADELALALNVSLTTNTASIEIH